MNYQFDNQASESPAIEYVAGAMYQCTRIFVAKFGRTPVVTITDTNNGAKTCEQGGWDGRSSIGTLEVGKCYTI